MAKVDMEKAMQKTLLYMRKSDPAITGILARGTVVWVQRWEPDENASPEQMKAGAGEWVTVVEGPFFLFSRRAPPMYYLVVMSRSPAQRHVTFSVTESFGFVPKKPNLHLMESNAKESGVYNFHFAGDDEGSQTFDSLVHVLEAIQSGAGPTLVPLIQEDVAPTMTPSLSGRMINVDDLFTQPSQSAPPDSIPVISAAKPNPGPTLGPSQLVSAAVSQPNLPNAHDTPFQSDPQLPQAKESNAQMRASDILAKLTAAKAPAARPLPRPVVPNGTTTGPPHPDAASAAPQQGRYVPPPPPPPEAPQASAAPNIIAELFGPTATKATRPAAPTTDRAMPAGPKVFTDAKMAAQPPGKGGAGPEARVKDTMKPPGGETVQDSGLSAKGKLGGLDNTQGPAGGTSRDVLDRRESVKQLLGILLKDDRFLDSISDAIDQMSMKS